MSPQYSAEEEKNHKNYVNRYLFKRYVKLLNMAHSRIVKNTISKMSPDLPVTSVRSERTQKIGNLKIINFFVQLNSNNFLD